MDVDPKKDNKAEITCHARSAMGENATRIRHPHLPLASAFGLPMIDFDSRCTEACGMINRNQHFVDHPQIDLQSVESFAARAGLTCLPSWLHIACVRVQKERDRPTQVESGSTNSVGG
jgi:hypothetical protein